MTAATRLRSRRSVAALAAVLTLTWAANAQAHCNTIDGPVTSMDCSAPDTANVNLAPAAKNQDEAGVHNASGKTVAIRTEGADSGVARDPAAACFLEALVRVHREWEGHFIPYQSWRANTKFSLTCSPGG